MLVFSYFADTVDWIVDRLDDVVAREPRLAAYRGRIAATSGKHDNKHEVLWGFAPRTTEAPDGRDEDRFDVVVATDVLAEGVNLQQARHIINYDLPWNPMRLVQRHGRIDRIGSDHREVFLRCVFPDARLDDLLGLEERLHRKIKQAAASVGIGGEILPGSRIEDVVFSETREEIERLTEEDAAIFTQAGSGRGALSGEEYRQELRAALENTALASQIRTLPWGSGSGMAVTGSKAGFVFCARVGDHPRPQFRHVSLVSSGEPSAIDDTLACLARARPPDGPAHERVLDEGTYRLAFDAWRHAKDDIVTKWNFASDPANLAPRVPAAMERAVRVIREHAPPALTTQDTDRLVEALEAPYPERILKQIRRAMNPSLAVKEQARGIVAVAEELGLEPSPPPEPLPEICEDDVHVVCWLAIQPPPG